MQFFESVSTWISANESLLNGLAAILVFLGFLFTALKALKGRWHQRGDTASQEVITLKSLTKPSPYPIQFASVDGLKIAFTVQGKGKDSILVAPGIISNLHVSANLPPLRDSMRRLGRFAKVINFDKRGQGLSDPTMDAATLEQRVRDIDAVVTANGLDKLFLMGISEGGPMSVQYAVENPDRIKGLILLGTTARFLRDESYPVGMSEKTLNRLVEEWGTGRTRDIFFPSISRDVMNNEVYQGAEKLLSDKRSMGQIVNYMKVLDVRPLLPQINCPTLVIHFSGDLAITVRMGRAMASLIPNAQFLEVEGVDHCDLGRAPKAIAAIEKFVREHQ